MSAAVFPRMTEGGQLLIWGLRHWMVAMLHSQYVPLSVERSLETVGGKRMFGSMVAMVLLAARDADRPLLIHPPCCDELSIDEEKIARAVSAFTENSLAAASAHLFALLGEEPSAALQRHVRIVADCFRAVGLHVAIEETVEWRDQAANG